MPIDINEIFEAEDLKLFKELQTMISYTFLRLNLSAEIFCVINKYKKPGYFYIEVKIDKRGNNIRLFRSITLGEITQKYFLFEKVLNSTGLNDDQNIVEAIIELTKENGVYVTIGDDVEALAKVLGIPLHNLTKLVPVIPEHMIVH